MNKIDLMAFTVIAIIACVSPAAAMVIVALWVALMVLV